MTNKNPSVSLVIVGGPMKTGTSALAAALTLLSRSNSLPRGFSYPIDSFWLPEFSGHKIVKHHAIGKFLAAETHETLDFLFSTMVEAARQVSPTEPHRVVVVWEGLARVACRDPQRVTELVSKLETIFTRVEIVFIKREPDPALHSLAQQFIRGPNAVARLSEIDRQSRKVSNESDHALPYVGDNLQKALKKSGLLKKTSFINFQEEFKNEPTLLIDFFKVFSVSEFDVTKSRMGSESIHKSFGKRTFDLLYVAARAQQLLGDKVWMNRLRLSGIDKLVTIRAQRDRFREATMSGRNLKR